MSKHLPKDFIGILQEAHRQAIKNADLIAACERGGVPGIEACRELQQDQERRIALMRAEFDKPEM